MRITDILRRSLLQSLKRSEGRGLEQKPTNELNDMLENMKPSELDDYIKKNRQYLADDEKAFYYYMKNVLDDKSIKLRDVYIQAGLSESYGGQIIRIEKHTKNRDVILRLCIAGHFSWNETNRALKLYGMSELYAKDPRDACLILEINNRIFDIDEINDDLAEHGFSTLSKDE